MPLTDEQVDQRAAVPVELVAIRAAQRELAARRAARGVSATTLERWRLLLEYPGAAAEAGMLMCDIIGRAVDAAYRRTTRRSGVVAAPPFVRSALT